MNTPLITRQQLEIINRKTLRYPLQIAEKDYFLAVVMNILSTSALGNSLIFKGGTAIHHCYLDQYRFSEDLDFSSNQEQITLTHIRSTFSDIPFLSIKKEYQSAATIKIEKLQYTGPLVLPNSLKIEVDFCQNVILAPLSKKYHNVWGLDFYVSVMDAQEICAEKIRAMSDRARYRDFYDLFLLIEKFPIDFSAIIFLIERKEIRKPITKDSILKNWLVVSSEKAKEMSQISYSRKIDDEKIRGLIESLPFDEIRSSNKRLGTDIQG